MLDAIDDATPDLKLESACGFETPWDAHAASLDLLQAAGKTLAVECVVAETTSDAEIARAAAFAATHAPAAPLILQPVTPDPGAPRARRWRPCSGSTPPRGRCIPTSG